MNIKNSYILFIVIAFQKRLHSKDVGFFHIQHNRMRHLRSAAEVFLLHIIEIGSWVGIVTFDSDASEKAPLQQITNDAARQKLVQCLPTIGSGQTNICAGIRKGLKVKHNVEISPGMYGK